MDSPHPLPAPAPLSSATVAARGRSPGRSAWLAGAAVLATLTFVTHAANFGFIIAGGRMLAPADFGTLTALLGIVLLGMAPGMAVQALSAAGTLGRPVVVDARLARRLGLVIGTLVAVVLGVLGPRIGVDSLVTLGAITAAAALLPVTAANEGRLQGRRRFALLGAVMVTGAAVKLAAGIAGMAAVPATWAAATAIGLGYLVQTTVSGRLAGPPPARVDDARRVAPAIVSAVAMMGLLLAVVHVDAVLAPILLDDLASGQYAVGVTGARVVFWAPQFAVLLLFPRLVTDHRRRVVAAAIGGLALAGTIGAGIASLVGTELVTLVFGVEFAPIGEQLWRFAWMGTAAIGLQVLALADLATGRRTAAWVLGGALVMVVGALLVAHPETPGGVITAVAGILTGHVLVGTVWRLARPARPRRPGGRGAGAT